MGQETQRSEVSLEEMRKTASDLKKSFSTTHQLLDDFERELELHLEEAMFLAWIEEGSLYDQAMRR